MINGKEYLKGQFSSTFIMNTLGTQPCPIFCVVYTKVQEVPLYCLIKAGSQVCSLYERFLCIV